MQFIRQRTFFKHAILSIALFIAVAFLHVSEIIHVSNATEESSALDLLRDEEGSDYVDINATSPINSTSFRIEDGKESEKLENGSEGKAFIMITTTTASIFPLPWATTIYRAPLHGRKMMKNTIQRYGELLIPS